MQLTLLSKQGKDTKKKITADKAVFDVDINHDLIRQAVHVLISNQRTVAAHTKTRSERRGGGAKPWRQKGTGRARHGSIRSPIWKGGGVTFGPRSDRNYTKKMTGKMKKNAIRSTFALLAKDKRVMVMEDPELKDARLTNQMSAIIDNSKVTDSVLFVHNGENNKLYLAGRNIPGVDVLPVNELNVYNLLRSDYVIMTDSALKQISSLWGAPQTGSEKTVTAKDEATKKDAKENTLKNPKSKKTAKTAKTTKKTTQGKTTKTRKKKNTSTSKKKS